MKWSCARVLSARLQITEVSEIQKVISAAVNPARPCIDVSCKENAVPYKESVQILAKPGEIGVYVDIDAML